MPYPIVAWTTRHSERADLEIALIDALTVAGTAPIRFFDGVLLIRDTSPGSVDRAASTVNAILQDFPEALALITPGRQGSCSECWSEVSDRDAAVPFVNVSGRSTFPRFAGVRTKPPIGGTP